MGRPRISRETRYCACGCKNTFICKINSKRKYINGHSRTGSKLTTDTRKKISSSNKGKHFKDDEGAVEERQCTCGCAKSFLCRKRSKKKFIKGHNLKTLNTRYWLGKKRSSETNKKISSTLKQVYKDFPELKERSRLTAVQMHANKKFPQTNTLPHRLIKEELNKGFDGFISEYPYNYYAIDEANPELKIALFIDGDYWHGHPSKYKVLDKRQKNQRRIDRSCNSFLKNRGWLVLRFWEIDIKKDINSCIEEVKQAILSRSI